MNMDRNCTYVCTCCKTNSDLHIQKQSFKSIDLFAVWRIIGCGACVNKLSRSWTDRDQLELDFSRRRLAIFFEFMHKLTSSTEWTTSISHAQSLNALSSENWRMFKVKILHHLIHHFSFIFLWSISQPFLRLCLSRISIQIRPFNAERSQNSVFKISSHVCAISHISVSLFSVDFLFQKPDGHFLIQILSSPSLLTELWTKQKKERDQQSQQTMCYRR